MGKFAIFYSVELISGVEFTPRFVHLITLYQIYFRGAYSVQIFRQDLIRPCWEVWIHQIFLSSIFLSTVLGSKILITFEMFDFIPFQDMYQFVASKGIPLPFEIRSQFPKELLSLEMLQDSIKQHNECTLLARIKTDLDDLDSQRAFLACLMDLVSIYLPNNFMILLACCRKVMLLVLYYRKTMLTYLHMVSG